MCIGFWYHLGHVCVGARGNSYKELVYNGTDAFVGGAKLVYVSGYVSCSKSTRNSHWGCNSGPSLAITITDADNRILYPSPRLVQRNSQTGWYLMPGYNGVSPELVFRDFCQTQYFNKGRKVRVWYGEDLRGYTEYDNHGESCMNVYLYFFRNPNV